MRRYEILNADGVKVSEQEHEENFAPALLAGHTARLVEVDGEKLARTSRPIIGPETSDIERKPVPTVLTTEADAAAAREAARAEKEAARQASEAETAKAEKAAAKAEAAPKDKPTT